MPRCTGPGSLRGVTVEAFRSAADFLASPHLGHTCCLIADVNMPCMSGVELYHHLGKGGYAIPTVLITAHPDDSIRARAIAAGVIGYLIKPSHEDALLQCVRAAIEITTCSTAIETVTISRLRQCSRD